ncbi:unnamed protein product [Paramecium primaurelia]|uniref:CDC20/Fizzy WD40 domain-containing protein n=1 Tax=Paramecium primaurelia TaxID=5886 RepID=A0A8S1MD35_PARPR|nr:unnamed protein product [Paramecium primaurelia]
MNDQTPIKEVDLNKQSWTSPKDKSDRFIPRNVQSNLYQLFMSEENSQGSLYNNLLQSSILGKSPTVNQKLFNYKTENKQNEMNKIINNGLKYSATPTKVEPEKPPRKINKRPYKILDAENLQDDFYLNLLDWSPFNALAVGLENSVLIWSGHTSKVSRLCTLEDPDMVCSVAWSQHNQHLSVGNSMGEVEVWDVTKQKVIRKWNGHQGRIGSLAWNNYLLATGSRDRNILVRDVRSPNESIQKYVGHKQEICGLKWSFDEQLLASGGNDNKLFIWSLKNQGEFTHFSQHQAAVKAIGWSPHQHNIVASGGGTADRCIRFFNTQTLEQVDCIDTGSQVCNLMFSKNSNELVSTHGYSLNQIIVWNYNNMSKVATLTGHTQRVLYLSGSPCGQNIVTGAGDETLRFWNVFPQSASKNDHGITRAETIDLR